MNRRGLLQKGTVLSLGSFTLRTVTLGAYSSSGLAKSGVDTLSSVDTLLLNKGQPADLILFNQRFLESQTWADAAKHLNVPVLVTQDNPLKVIQKNTSLFRSNRNHLVAGMTTESEWLVIAGELRNLGFKIKRESFVQSRLAKADSQNFQATNTLVAWLAEYS